jgi:hypothetical protein
MSIMPSESIRLAVDIGGTFTDVVVETPSARVSTKVLTTKSAPEDGVLDGMLRALALTSLQPPQIGLIVHGTTLATNAIIERKGAATALITIRGFRDSIGMAQENRFEQYDIFIEKPEPLVPRDLRFTVPERIDAAGRVRLPLDEAAVEALADTLKAKNIDSVAISFLHSYANPAHEQRAAEILSACLPGVFAATVDASGAIRLTARAAASTRPAPGVGLIDYPVMWNRLISVVEEQAQTLVRTAFGTATREAGDLSAGVYDTSISAGAASRVPPVRSMRRGSTCPLPRSPIGARSISG